MQCFVFECWGFILRYPVNDIIEKNIYCRFTPGIMLITNVCLYTQNLLSVWKLYNFEIINAHVLIVAQNVYWGYCILLDTRHYNPNLTQSQNITLLNFPKLAHHTKMNMWHKIHIFVTSTAFIWMTLLMNI